MHLICLIAISGGKHIFYQNRNKKKNKRIFAIMKFILTIYGELQCELHSFLSLAKTQCSTTLIKYQMVYAINITKYNSSLWRDIKHIK